MKNPDMRSIVGIKYRAESEGLKIPFRGEANDLNPFLFENYFFVVPFR
jgi:hypothetical protein